MSIIERINRGERAFINNHICTEEVLDGYVVLETIDGNVGHICPVFRGSAFCLNPLYEDVDDNKLHLSTCSVGDNMNGVYCDFDKEVEKYNSSTLGRRIIEYKIFYNGD